MDDDKPFDAAESYFCDAPEATMAKWRTSSLVTALRGILERQPQFEQGGPQARREAFRATADELTRRGLDALALIRYGMLETITASVITALTQSTVENQERPGGMSRSDADRWWVALSLSPRPTFPDTPNPAEVQHLITGVIGPGIPRIVNWIATTASIDDLLELTPPSDVLPESSGSSLLNSDLHDQYAWAIDHFSSAFYSEWSTSSLHYAHRWLAGHELPPCDPDLMNDRRIDQIQLNAEIARRASTRKRRRSGRPRIDSLMASEMQQYAVSLLTRGRYQEAATIFKFAANQRPYDANFQNNIGFCLIPEDPLEALRYLRTAADMDYRHPAVNLHNQMYCHAALHRPREALTVAESMWPEVRSTRSLGATLWRRDNRDKWVITNVTGDRIAAVDLAISLAHAEGWDADEAAWRERRNELQ